MSEAILSDYFYGDESQQFIFFKIPRQLITDPRFRHISNDAKLLYGMLLDRMSLSSKRGWYDEGGRVYIKSGIFSIFKQGTITITLKCTSCDHKESYSYEHIECRH